MENASAPDPGDWRIWPREGVRIFPPPETTPGQAVAGCAAFSAARWGIHPDHPGKDRRNVIRVLKKVDGGYEQVSFRRVADGKAIDVRVRGGCRVTADPGS